MKKLWAAIIILLLLAFYVMWPSWSVYQIYSAVKTKDADTLARKIDFPAVRVSLRNAAVQKIAELYDRPQSQLPSNPVLVARIKQEAASRIVDASLERLVTADNLIRITSESGQLRESVERILRDHISGVGDSARKADPGTSGVGKGGPVIRTIAPEGERPARSYGLHNVKSFGMLNPLRFEIGVAKDATANEADLTAELSFTGTDWKLTAVKPRL
jgi:Protein of unknown function (DUF2939)